MSDKDKIIAEFTPKALNYNVIVKEIANDNVTTSGLDISKLVDKNEKYRKAFVVSIGNLIDLEVSNSCIEVGSEVIFDNFKASEITINGGLYKNVLYSDLLFVL